MKGILFTGGAAPDPGLALPLLPDYDFIVAADSGLDTCERFKLVPDMIVGDMDSLRDPASLDRYPADRIRSWPRDKDYTDTELALQCLKERGVDEVVLVGGGGGRIDHFLALRALIDRPYCPALWVGDESVCAVFGSGTPSRSITVSGLSRESPVSVFPAGVGPHRARGIGLHWAIDALSWSKGEYSLSNRSESESATLEAIEGRFFAIVPLARGVTVERPR